MVRRYDNTMAEECPITVVLDLEVEDRIIALVQACARSKGVIKTRTKALREDPRFNRACGGFRSSGVAPWLRLASVRKCHQLQPIWKTLRASRQNFLKYIQTPATR